MALSLSVLDGMVCSPSDLGRPIDDGRQDGDGAERRPAPERGGAARVRPRGRNAAARRLVRPGGPTRCRSCTPRRAWPPHRHDSLPSARPAGPCRVKREGRGAPPPATGARLSALRPAHSAGRPVEPPSPGAEAEGRRQARHRPPAPGLPQRHPRPLLGSRTGATPQRRREPEGRPSPGRFPRLGPHQTERLPCPDAPDARSPGRARQITPALIRAPASLRPKRPAIARS